MLLKVWKRLNVLKVTLNIKFPDLGGFKYRSQFSFNFPPTQFIHESILLFVVSIGKNDPRCLDPAEPLTDQY